MAGEYCAGQFFLGALRSSFLRNAAWKFSGGDMWNAVDLWP